MKIVLSHDRKISIAVGRSRFEKSWQQAETTVSALFSRLSESKAGSETHAELLAMPDAERDTLKDCGGFVAGVLRDGRRAKSAVQGRSCVTLDFDSLETAANMNALLKRLDSLNCAFCVYSTRKHLATTPRLRALLPLDEDAPPAEFEAISRKVVELLDAAQWVDPGSFQPERLMYWPSHCIDVQPFFHYADRPLLSKSGMLSKCQTVKQRPRLSNEAAASDNGFTLPEGARNAGLYRIACRLRADGLTDEAILAAVQLENEKRCTPPLENAEVLTIVKSACTHAPGFSNGMTVYSAPAITTGAQDFAALGLMLPTNGIDYSDPSDTQNAMVFAKAFRERAAYTPGMGWLWFADTHWRADEEAILRAGMALSNALVRDALERCKTADAELRNAQAAGTESLVPFELKVKQAEKWLRHARATRDGHKLRAMIDLAKALLRRESADFDADSHALNTPGGIVDLRTGTISPCAAEARCTKITAAAPGDLGRDEWLRFLDTVAGGDGQFIEYLQMALGSCLFGMVHEERLLIAFGSGSNGKSSLLNCVASVLHQYSGAVAVETFTTRQQNPRAAYASLRGSRFVQCSELETGATLSTSTLKQLCATDPVVAEAKYCQPETIVPSWHVCLTTNVLPRVSARDTGTWRRLTVIPFTTTITPETKIPNYAKHLAEHCGPAVLQWLIDGAVAFYAAGCKIPSLPKRVLDATAAYRAGEDWLQQFIDACCELQDGAKIRAQDLYNRYASWAAGQGERRPKSLKEFGTAMAELPGVCKTKGRNGTVYEGVLLLD